MIYVVGGMWRSGTSAMMNALRLGGLPVLHDLSRERDLERLNTPYYRLNPAVWEPSRAQISERDFPLAYSGHVVKLMGAGTGKLAAGEYKMLVMTRHPEEIRQSFKAMAANSRSPGAPPFLDWDPPYGQQQWFEYWTRIRVITGIATVRSDIGLTREVRYREDLLADPTEVFTSLADDGWPIDPYIAANSIDEEHCRVKFEDLELGI